MNPSTIGFLRGLGIVIIAGVCDYVAQHIGASGLVSAGLATIIAAIASMIEHAITANTGNALLGTTRVR